MKIEPIAVWKDGGSKTATDISVQSEFDNLSTEAKFFYRLQNEEDFNLVSGYLTMSGEDYENWDNSNEAAYLWVIDQLDLSAE
jgi:hypothetical protein